MTVFEDLIVELKEENLLEETVISVEGGHTAGMFALQPAEEHDFAELIEGNDAQIETAAQIVDKDRVAKPPARKSNPVTAIVEQMATFQTVEHILSAIDRSGSTRDRGGFDELEANKALHTAQQNAGEESSEIFENAVEELRSQVAIWQSSLAAGDEGISVSAMR